MVTLELPPPVEQKLREKAEGQGLTLEAFLLRVAEREVTGAPTTQSSLYGSLAHLGVNISLEDIQQARREMWANFPRDFPEPEQQ